MPAIRNGGRADLAFVESGRRRVIARGATAEVGDDIAAALTAQPGVKFADPEEPASSAADPSETADPAEKEGTE